MDESLEKKSEIKEMNQSKIYHVDEKTRTEQDISVIIDSENKAQFNMLIDNGVILSQEHIIKLLFSKSTLVNQKVIDMAFLYYAKDIKEKTVEVFQQLNDYIKNGEDFYEANKKSEKYKTKLAFDNISYFLKKNTNYFLGDKEAATKIYFLNQELVKNIDNLKYKSFIKATREIPQSLSESLEKRYNELSHDSIVDLIKRAKTTHNMEHHIAQNIIVNIGSYNINNLPKRYQMLVKDINQLFLDIEGINLAQENSFRVKNLYEKRLPQVLSEYFSIPERYRASLSHEKENPDAL